MSTTQRDVKLVFGGLAGDITATPQGTSLSGLIGSGIPQFQGTTAPQPTISVDLNDGTSNATLGLTLGGSLTAAGQLPFKKHSWDPIGGLNGSGAIKMHWFTGMQLGFSPTWVGDFTSGLPSFATPAPASRSFRHSWWVRQNVILDVPGSNCKMNRIRLGTGTFIGGLFSGGGGSPGRPIGQFRWHWELWDTQKFVGAFLPGTRIPVLTPTDDLFHLWELECDYSDNDAANIKFWLDGVLIIDNTTPSTNAVNLWDVHEDEGMILSPFTEMVSCGQSGCQDNINTGDQWFDNFQYTPL